MATRRVSLKEIAKQIDNAEKQLQLVSRTAPPPQQTQIKEKIRRLNEVRSEVEELCGHVWVLTFPR